MGKKKGEKRQELNEQGGKEKGEKRSDWIVVNWLELILDPVFNKSPV